MNNYITLFAFFLAGVTYAEWRIRLTWEQKRNELIKGIVETLAQQGKQLKVIKE